MKKIFTAILFVLLLQIQPMTGLATDIKNDKNIAVGPETNGYQLIISTTNKTFSVGQDILLAVALKNVSTNAVTVFAGSAYLHFYKVKIVDSGGNEISMTEWGKEMFESTAMYYSSRQKIDPGESYSVPMVLNALFQMSKPDEYTITISRYVAVHGDKPSGIWISSAPLKIKVTSKP
jgi:hypothetical protein